MTDVNQHCLTETLKVYKHTGLKRIVCTFRMKLASPPEPSPGLTDLQLELVAGVASVELRAGQPEPSLRELCGLPVVVPDLSDHLLVAGHGVHACGKTRGGWLAS